MSLRSEIFSTLPAVFYTFPTMHLNLLAILSIAAVSLAAPAPEAAADTPTTWTETTPGGLTITYKDGGFTDNKKMKRETTTETTDGGMIITYTDAKTKRNALAKRSSDYISSCGPKSGWIPIQYFGTDAQKYLGWNDAVKLYCSGMNGKIISAGKKASSTIRFENDAQHKGRRVTLKNYKPGHIECE